jgi:uncharacterized protein RhaS with RHS repeats
VRRPCSATRANEGRVDRYYDPATDQFLSVDPDLAATGQPYAFTGDDPLNKTDPLGLLSHGVNKQQQACERDPHRKGCQGHSISHELVSGLDKLRHGGASILDDQQQIDSQLTGHHEVALCLNAAGGGGVGGTASVCAGNTGNGKPFASVTVGGGGTSPSGSATVGLQVGNAQTPSDLRGPFGYQGGSADLGPSVGGGGFEGNGSNSQGITGVDFNFGVGADIPIPFEVHGGASYTWTTPN